MKWLYILLLQFLVTSSLAQTLEQQFVLKLQQIEQSNSTEKSKDRGKALAQYIDQSKQLVGNFQTIKADAANILSMVIQYDALAGMYTLIYIQNLDDAKQLKEALPQNQQQLMVNALTYHTQHYQDGTLHPDMPAKGTGSRGTWNDFYTQIIQPMIAAIPASTAATTASSTPKPPTTTSKNNSSTTTSTNTKSQNTTTTPAADQLKEALRLFNNKQYKEALVLIEPLVKQQVPAAQGMLADYYYYGLGGMKANDSLAFYYNKRAADAGYLYSIYMMSELYTHGIGTKRNADLALHYHQKSLEHNYHLSQELVTMAKDGLTKGAAMYQQALASKDSLLKLQYLEQAADVYHLPAIQALMQIKYAAKIYDETYYWAAVGAMLKNKDCIEELNYLEMEYGVMLSVLGIYNSDNLGYLANAIALNYLMFDTNYDVAYSWAKRAERLGNRDVYYPLGIIYSSNSKYKNVPLAKDYLQKAAANGYKDAEALLKTL